MELTQLRYFLRVYQTQNITNASVQLNVSQQAISKQIQRLEEELGVVLFIRNSRGVQATEYAELLAQNIQGFLPELDSLIYNIQRKNSEVTGIVRLGVQCWQMSVNYGLEYEILRDFERTYPKVHLIWENSIPKRCLQGLKNRELDLAVITMPKDPEDYDLTFLRRFHWFMLMSKRHPLSVRNRLSVTDLAGHKIILANNETVTRNRIIKELEGKEKPIFIDVGDFIFDLIGQQIEGEGAMMLTTETVLDQFNPEKLIMVPIEDSKIWDAQLYLARIHGVSYTPAQEVLFQFLLKKWKR